MKASSEWRQPDGTYVIGFQNDISVYPLEKYSPDKTPIHDDSTPLMTYVTFRKVYGVYQVIVDGQLSTGMLGEDTMWLESNKEAYNDIKTKRLGSQQLSSDEKDLFYEYESRSLRVSEMDNSVTEHRLSRFHDVLTDSETGNECVTPVSLNLLLEPGQCPPDKFTVEVVQYSYMDGDVMFDQSTTLDLTVSSYELHGFVETDFQAPTVLVPYPCRHTEPPHVEFTSGAPERKQKRETWIKGIKAFVTKNGKITTYDVLKAAGSGGIAAAGGTNLASAAGGVALFLQPWLSGVVALAVGVIAVGGAVYATSYVLGQGKINREGKKTKVLLSELPNVLQRCWQYKADGLYSLTPDEVGNQPWSTQTMFDKKRYDDLALTEYLMFPSVEHQRLQEQLSKLKAGEIEPNTNKTKEELLKDLDTLKREIGLDTCNFTKLNPNNLEEGGASVRFAIKVSIIDTSSSVAGSTHYFSASKSDELAAGFISHGGRASLEKTKLALSAIKDAFENNLTSLDSRVMLVGDRGLRHTDFKQSSSFKRKFAERVYQRVAGFPKVMLGDFVRHSKDFVKSCEDAVDGSSKALPKANIVHSSAPAMIRRMPQVFHYKKTLSFRGILDKQEYVDVGASIKIDSADDVAVSPADKRVVSALSDAVVSSQFASSSTTDLINLYTESVRASIVHRFTSKIEVCPVRTVKNGCGLAIASSLVYAPRMPLSTLSEMHCAVKVMDGITSRNIEWLSRTSSNPLSAQYNIPSNHTAQLALGVFAHLLAMEATERLDRSIQSTLCFESMNSADLMHSIQDKALQQLRVVSKLASSVFSYTSVYKVPEEDIVYKCFGMYGPILKLAMNELPGWRSWNTIPYPSTVYPLSRKPHLPRLTRSARSTLAYISQPKQQLEIIKDYVSAIESLSPQSTTDPWKLPFVCVKSLRSVSQNGYMFSTHANAQPGASLLCAVTKEVEYAYIEVSRLYKMASTFHSSGDTATLLMDYVSSIPLLFMVSEEPIEGLQRTLEHNTGLTVASTVVPELTEHALKALKARMSAMRINIDDTVQVKNSLEELESEMRSKCSLDGGYTGVDYYVPFGTGNASPLSQFMECSVADAPLVLGTINGPTDTASELFIGDDPNSRHPLIVSVTPSIIQTRLVSISPPVAPSYPKTSPLSIKEAIDELRSLPRLQSGCLVDTTSEIMWNIERIIQSCVLSWSRGHRGRLIVPMPSKEEAKQVPMQMTPSIHVYEKLVLKDHLKEAEGALSKYEEELEQWNYEPGLDTDKESSINESIESNKKKIKVFKEAIDLMELSYNKKLEEHKIRTEGVGAFNKQVVLDAEKKYLHTRKLWYAIVSVARSLCSRLAAGVPLPFTYEPDLIKFEAFVHRCVEGGVKAVPLYQMCAVLSIVR